MKFSIESFANLLPAVSKPEIKPAFKEKIFWTGLMLILFYFLGSVFVFGLNKQNVLQFEFYEIVFGSKFGSIITLGIGPIVTASIILQLLVGSKVLGWNTQTPEGKAKFMGMQKLLAISFCFIEAAAYVMAGAVPVSTHFDPATHNLVASAVPGAQALPGFTVSLLTIGLVVQLALGGIVILFMDEVVSKWGIGSGVSLFIAAGVSKTIIVGLFSPPFTDALKGTASGGLLWGFVNSLAVGQPNIAFETLLPLIATAVVFAIVFFVQGIKVEIPLAFSLPFGKFASRRWPLKFLYTSNIPVILMAAVLANVQVVARALADRGIGLLGTFSQASQNSAPVPIGGLIYYLTLPGKGTFSPIPTIAIFIGIFTLLFIFLASTVFKKYIARFAVLGGIIGLMVGIGIIAALGELGSLGLADVPREVLRTITYISVLTVGSIIFSVFWVNTAGMDAQSVAKQFESSALMIPGFRRDPRIIENVLQKYIPALTILGGAFIGLLAGFADVTGALGTGTGILLTVMIVYQLYETIVNQHYEDLPEWARKFIKGGNQ